MIRRGRFNSDGVTAPLRTSVPVFVPTPCLEVLLTVESAPPSARCKLLQASNDWESLATIVTIANLLIRGTFLPPEQKVRGSNPLGRTTFPRVPIFLAASFQRQRHRRTARRQSATQNHAIMCR